MNIYDRSTWVSYKPERKKSKNKTSEDVFIVYEITSSIISEKYVGFTASIGKRGHQAAIKRRFAKHVSDAKRDNRPLYIAMRKYGIETFKIEIKKVFADPTKPGIWVEEEARKYELELIKSGEYKLNLQGRKNPISQ